jgi:anti-sigma factor RsiW
MHPNTPTHTPPDHTTANERTLYLDDRLDAAEREALERHCAECAECRRALAEEGALHELLRASFPMPQLSDAFIRESYAQTKRHLEQVMAEGRASAGLFARISDLFHSIVNAPRWAVAPLGAAALAVALLSSTAGFKSPLVDFVVTSHAQQWPTEVSTSAMDQVQSWFVSQSTPNKTLEVPRFERLANAGVHLERARLSLAMVGQNRWERAAHLLYSFAGDKRVTVLAFQGAPEALTEGTAHEVEGTQVYVTQRDALTVAYYSRDGLSYMVTSDLHQDELFKMIAADLAVER